MKAKTVQNISTGLLYSALIVFLIWFFRNIDLSLIYHNNQPFFSNTKHFLFTYLEYPGGIADYFGLYLFQFYENAFRANIIVLIQLVIFGTLSYFLFRKYYHSSIIAIPVVFVSIPMIIEYANYQFSPGFPVAYILALSVALINLLTKRQKTIGYIVLILSTFFVFYIAGLTGLLLFGSIIIVTGFEKKRFIQSGVVIALVVLLPFLWLLFDPSYSSFREYLTNRFLSGSPPFITQLFNSLPLIFFVLLVSGIFLKKLFASKRIPAWVFLISFIIVFPVITWATYNKCSNPQIKKNIIIDRLACNREWDQLLNTVDNRIAQDKLMLSFIYRAYFHQGFLLDSLCKYPPVYKENALIVQEEHNYFLMVILSDIYYEMGLLNEARHWVNEVTTISGWHPRTLKRLAECYIISGEYNTAAKYLNILKTSPVTRKWAIEHEKYLHCNDCVLANPEYKHIILSSPETDFFAAIEDPFINLQNLIVDSNSSKMAFEYYVAYELLKYHPESLNELIKKFQKYNYKKLPRSVQEAILVENPTLNVIETDLLDYQIDPSIYADFEKISEILFGEYKGNIAQAKPALKNYSKTYWYYYLYSRPTKTKEQAQ